MNKSEKMKFASMRLSSRTLNVPDDLLDDVPEMKASMKKTAAAATEDEALAKLEATDDKSPKDEVDEESPKPADEDVDEEAPAPADENVDEEAPKPADGGADEEAKTE